MKIEAVRLMRDIRNQLSEEIKDMSWEEEQAYLRSQIRVFDFLVEKVPENALQSDGNARPILRKQSLSLQNFVA